jgi:flagellar basal-body rod modification protein FlgD
MSTVNAPSSYVASDPLKTKSAEPGKKDAPASSVEADTNKFLTLLVTQLKNQDPMNPLDNAQLTSQLAQLSTVTGVNKLNDTLETLKASYQSSESLQAANLIGHGVLVEGDFIGLAGGKAIMGVELATPADHVKVIISDPVTGKDVQEIELGPQEAGTVPLLWDGVVDPTKLDSAGKPIALKDGKYNFRVVADRAGEELKDAKTLSFDLVASVTTSVKDGVKLNLPSAGVVTMADVRQIL